MIREEIVGGEQGATRQTPSMLPASVITQVVVRDSLILGMGNTYRSKPVMTISLPWPQHIDV